MVWNALTYIVVSLTVKVCEHVAKGCSVSTHLAFKESLGTERVPFSLAQLTLLIFFFVNSFSLTMIFIASLSLGNKEVNKVKYSGEEYMASSALSIWSAFA